MQSRALNTSKVGYRLIKRLDRRSWPILCSVAFVGLGSAYFFQWGPVVRHQRYSWLEPVDLGRTYLAASQAAHGHFGAIYQSGLFLALPGILVALVPFGALSNVFRYTLIEISKHHHPLARPEFALFHPAQGILNAGLVTIRGNQYIVQPQWFAFVGPYMLLLSCMALFACDALAQRLGVSKTRRALLCIFEAVVLWNVTVFWGHPEDALAVALGVYALVFALDGRFVGSAWLFGCGLAFQPLVVVILPVLLAMAGRRRLLGLVVRGVVPAAAVLVAPLASGFHATVHTLVTEPAFPDLPANHQTPWTFLASKVSGHGTDTTLAGGPIRTASLALAAGLGWWAVRWREKPELIVWAVALALALRVYTESVMTPYYVWPALAVGLVVAARASGRTFGACVAVAIGTTIVAQWHLAWLPWWVIDVAGVTVLLVAAASARLVPVGAPAGEQAELGHAGRWLTDLLIPKTAPATPARAAQSSSRKRKQRKAARTNRKRSARR